MDRLTQDLTARGYTLIETHISRVFLGAEYVYKTKKPLNLGFLDFRTLADRKRYCDAEVVLNRRLAPDVYLGTVPICRDAAGGHVLEGSGEPLEWAVKMRRLDDARSFEALLARGALERRHLEQLAAHLADFHAAARGDAEVAQHGSLSVIEGNVRENFEQTRDSAGRYLDAEERAQIEGYQLAFLRDQAALFQARVAAGRIREGHGDLRLEHCYLQPDGSIAVIDCIEFNERFRHADVCADVAFLAMDLSWHDQVQLGEAFLAAYASESGDYDLYALVDFYTSYRAYVRGKVGSMLADDASAPTQVRARAAEQARKYYLLAEAEAGEPLQAPLLIGVGGLIASGKSTLARALGELLSAPVVCADRLRKQLLGLAPTTALREGAFAGQYSAEATRRVYAELLRCARVVLESGRPVVVDASFRCRTDRQALQALAGELGVAFWFVECSVPEDVTRARLQDRASGPSVSDGRAEIFDAFARSYEPVDELAAPVLQRVDTSLPLEDNLARVRAALRRPG